MTSIADLFAGVTLLLFVVGGIASFDLLFTGASETPEYKQGFTDGYNEQNYTKYQAADEISSSIFGYTDEQIHYARGYKYGYSSFQNDNYSRSQAEKRNETARILGVYSLDPGRKTSLDQQENFSGSQQENLACIELPRPKGRGFLVHSPLR